MKNIVTFSIGLICGAAVGGTTVYLYLNKKYNEKFENEVNKEIEEFKSTFKPVTIDISKEKEYKKEKKEIDDKTDTIKTNTNKSFDVKKSSENLNTKKIDYAKLIRQLNGEPFEAEDIKPETEEEYRERNKVEGMATPPYKIREEEFEEQNGYEKRFIMYYEKSDVFADADDTRLNLEETMDMIGPFTTDDFGAMGSYGLMFVRNEQYGIDYQVELDDENEFDGLEW